MTDNIKLPPYGIAGIWSLIQSMQRGEGEADETDVTEAIEDFAREAVRLNAATAADGWVLRPIEPTPEMIEAGRKYFKSTYDDIFTSAQHYKEMNAVAPEPQPAPASGLRRLIADDALAMSFQSLGQYRSMLLKALDAAPESQASPVADERKAFEAWFEPRWSGPQSDLAAWAGWQARAALAVTPGPQRNLTAEEHRVMRAAVADSAELVAHGKLVEAEPQGVPEAFGYTSSLGLRLFKGSSSDHTISLRHIPKDGDVPVYVLSLAAHPQQSGAAQPEQERKPQQRSGFDTLPDDYELGDY